MTKKSKYVNEFNYEEKIIKGKVLSFDLKKFQYQAKEIIPFWDMQYMKHVKTRLL